MSADNSGIEKGMKVYTSGGGDLGKITHVWTGVGDSPTSPQDYFVVGEGGFLGIGEQYLYIPFDAIEVVVPGESITVNCSQEKCIDLYAAKPEGIRKKELTIAQAAVVASTTQVIFH